MPKLPTDMDAARAHTARQAAKRSAAEQRRREADKHDEQMVRDLENRLRAEAGEPPLRPDEPVTAIVCRRGRR